MRTSIDFVFGTHQYYYYLLSIVLEHLFDFLRYIYTVFIISIIKEYLPVIVVQ